ncbi:MAG TPA: glycosyltransferase family 2 protein, partial [Nitrososphaera sp.]|nr:glycosyltransferase family 2 protein [Nitrososphaera sp.]
KSQPSSLSDLDKLVTIVIPTLNEEKGIASVIEELHGLGLRNIMVVDGYSQDKTREIAARLGALIIPQQGKGKTGALKTAIENVRTPYMLVMDGDYTYDAGSIQRLVAHMRSYDEVIGARVPTSKESMTNLHKFGNAVITRVFNSLMSTNLSDVCSGMYVLKTAAAGDIHLATSGFDVEAEIAAQIASAGTITEVPINYRPRLGRQKLSTWKHGFRIIHSILGLARSYNPGVYYSMLGGLIIIPAIGMIASSTIEMTLTGRITSPWFFVGISMVLVAIQAMGVGVVSLMLRRSELRSARRLAKLFDKS